MNALQKEVFLIFESFLKVCKDLSLKYYLANGSALGAVKYGGFIEWDDDIDIVMPRKDYEIFCAKAQVLLPNHIFLQNYRTDKKFPFFYTKLRNSNTTFIEKGVRHLDINHGLYIDIFPLDGYPDCEKDQQRLKRKLKLLTWKQFCVLKNNNQWKVSIRNTIFRCLNYHRKTDKTLQKMETLICTYGNNTTNWCDYGDRQGKGCFPREYYGDGLTVTFENVSVIVPEQIDAYLTYKYGAWREDLKESDRKSHHETIICDLNTPYTEYRRRNL